MANIRVSEEDKKLVGLARDALSDYGILKLGPEVTKRFNELSGTSKGSPERSTIAIGAIMILEKLKER